MRISVRAVSRTFAVVSAVLVLASALLVGPLWRPGPPDTRGFPPSQRLTDAFMSLLCRPPDDAETLRWDTKPFTIPELAASVRATDESLRVRAIRRVYLDELFRDPFDGDCAGVRQWWARPLSPPELGRRLARSPEAERMREVRHALREAQGRDPAGWDNGTIRRWAQTGLTPDEVRVRVVEQRTLVGVHFFNWYKRDAERWGNGGTTVPRDTPRPSLGWYESTDAAIIDAQIDQLDASGIDFVIVQIIAEDSELWATAHRFFERLKGRRLRAAVMLDGLYTTPASDATAWIEKARRELTGHSNYLWLRGQPLVLLYSARLDASVPGTLLRNVYWAEAYGQGQNPFNSDGLLLPHDWPFWAPTPQPIVNGVVPIIPGYSDSHLAREQSMEHARDDGRMYHEQWQRALELRPEFILVYSWNEHFERTAIEPTDAWGDRYVRWTSCYAALARAGQVGRC